jgi:DNA-binding transcriptional ArsR family regulator
MPEITEIASSRASAPPQSGKSIEERLAFAIRNRTRVYVLTLLNEGVYCSEELAEIIGEPVGNIAHHIRKLLDDGSIEHVKSEPVRNTLQHFYRAIKMPFYTDEELAAMTPEERQAIIGLTLQCLMAEIMTAFWSRKMEADPRLWLAWRWFNVDEQGRQDLADEQERSWQRSREIEAESANRCAESGEETRSIIGASAGFERARTAPTAAPPVSNFSER